MKLSAPIYRLKRQAKILARQTDKPLNQTLDAIARQEGYRSWSHLSAKAGAKPVAARLLDRLQPGQLVILAGRPGQGKTRLALSVAAEAVMRGDEAWFFTLEFTEAHTRQLLQSSGYAAASRDRFLKIDTSEDLSADYLVQRLRRHGSEGRWIAVVDYLQLLDQQRWKPGLQQQLQTLKQFAVNEGGRIVLLSQVDRYFDERETAMPAADDMRLPNPVKKEAFDHFCAIHDGVVQFQGKTI